ncbi:hypothetical protein BDQ17DRAFT_1422535 [Cyathus striatus]|nr:hypothetical protein BDQ17DRAFT_1422535 [Cyathus striatus]
MSKYPAVCTSYCATPGQAGLRIPMCDRLDLDVGTKCANAPPSPSPLKKRFLPTPYSPNTITPQIPTHTVKALLRTILTCRTNPKRKIYATNIPKPYDIEEIKDIFSQFGTVENVKMGRSSFPTAYPKSHYILPRKGSTPHRILCRDHIQRPRKHPKGTRYDYESPLQLGMNVLKIEYPGPPLLPPLYE